MNEHRPIWTASAASAEPRWDLRKHEIEQANDYCERPLDDLLAARSIAVLEQVQEMSESREKQLRSCKHESHRYDQFVGRPKLKLDAGRGVRSASYRKTCSALSSVLETGRPAGALLGGGVGVDTLRMGGPPRLLSARHLPNHQFAGRHLLPNDFEFRLMPVEITLKSRLLHLQSVAGSKFVAYYEGCKRVAQSMQREARLLHLQLTALEARSDAQDVRAAASESDARRRNLSVLSVNRMAAKPTMTSTQVRVSFMPTLNATSAVRVALPRRV